MTIQIEEYDTGSGHTIHRFTLESNGLRAVLVDGGARLVEFHVPDRHGRRADVVLGFEHTTPEGENPYFGATCGRYANRIRQGTFPLDGETVSVSINEGSNHLHGGRVGFDRHRWSWEVDETRNAVLFSLTSPDGDQGFPGELVATAEYTLGDTTLDIGMTAISSRPTVVNMVHHSYWNLGGHDAGDVLGHRLEVASDFYTPVDDELLPTGEVLAVEGSPFDFREAREVGSQIREIDHGGAGRDAPAGFAGYDHNWVVRGQVGRMRPCVSVHEPESGRRMELTTDEAGVQIYSGGYLDAFRGKSGAVYEPFQGLTLETQRFPDSPNNGHFPSTVLRPGQRYDHRMAFSFRVE